MNLPSGPLRGDLRRSCGNFGADDADDASFGADGFAELLRRFGGRSPSSHFAFAFGFAFLVASFLVPESSGSFEGGLPGLPSSVSLGSLGSRVPELSG
jgi:hypothetical protein